MVKEILSSDEFSKEINVPNLVVVDFYATWCGPCKMIAPFIEQMERKYPEVVFIKVADHNCKNLMLSLGVQAFPTFHFYVNGKKVDEIKGADPRTLESKINQHKTAGSFGGSGFTLGAPSWNGVGQPPSAASAREARLKALASVEAKPSIPPKLVEEKTNNVEDEDEELAMAIALSIAEGKDNKVEEDSNKGVPMEVESDNKNSQKLTSEEEQDQKDQVEAEAEVAAAETKGEVDHGDWDEEMVPVPVDDHILSELIDMGFPDVRARKGIVHGKTLEGALTWLTEHLEDPDIDQPYMVRKRDTIPKIPLTEEEKAKRLEAMKLKVKQRREERARQEKAEELKKEKERRERGQTLGETQEERDRLARKREAEKIKREKDDAKRERERLRQEIAADKEARKKNKGVLPSVLGADGYNPSIIQYDAGKKTASSSDATTTSTTSSSTSSSTSKEESSGDSGSTLDIAGIEKKADSIIGTLMRYRTAGDGGQALKLLLTFVKNVVDAPKETKFRSINTESKAFKTKLAPLIGPTQLLRLIGFEKIDGETRLYLEKPNPELFSSVLNKLIAADQAYTKMNS